MKYDDNHDITSTGASTHFSNILDGTTERHLQRCVEEYTTAELLFVLKKPKKKNQSQLAVALSKFVKVEDHGDWPHV